MKKFFCPIFILILACSLFLISGCKKEENLTDYVSQLRSDIFIADGEFFHVKAEYGYQETPFVNDGIMGEKVYALTFKITENLADASTKIIEFNYGGIDYKSEFILDPKTDLLTANFEIENFNQKQFIATLKNGATAESLTFNSTLPQGTISVSEALKFFCKNQPDLYQSFKDENGKFCAEIYARVIVKDGKPYYYLGFATGKDKLKALLIDGANGEVLAVRDVF